MLSPGGEALLERRLGEPARLEQAGAEQAEAGGDAQEGEGELQSAGHRRSPAGGIGRRFYSDRADPASRRRSPRRIRQPPPYSAALCPLRCAFALAVFLLCAPAAEDGC